MTLRYPLSFQAGGVGGACITVFLIPYQGDLKSKELAQRALKELAQKLRKRPANPTSTLSHWFHTGHMEPTKPAKIVLGIIAAAMLAGWALVIWVATLVTQTALDTLAYIVDLAQYTP